MDVSSEALYTAWWPSMTGHQRLDEEPAAEPKLARKRRVRPVRQVDILTGEEVASLIEACNKRAPTGIRNRALIALLYRSGLRLQESLDLVPGDVDHANRAIRVRHGKGDKQRTSSVSADALEHLARWLEVRDAYALPESRLFCTLRGAPLSPTYVRAMLRRKAERAGIAKRVHPHGLRHTHAAELARERVPLVIISAQLGHENVATTSRYIAHISAQEVIDALADRGGEL